MTRAIETYLQDHNIGLKFQVHGDTGDIVVKVFNKEDGELIREIPMEHLAQSVVQRGERVSGLLHVVA